MKKKRKGLFRWFRKGSAGVTVFEVMIALALFAVIITPVMRSFVTAIKVNKRSRDVMVATDVADAIMEGIQGKTYEEVVKALVSSGAGFTTSVEDGTGSARLALSSINNNWYNQGHIGGLNPAKVMLKKAGAAMTAGDYHGDYESKYVNVTNRNRHGYTADEVDDQIMAGLAIGELAGYFDPTQTYEEYTSNNDDKLLYFGFSGNVTYPDPDTLSGKGIPKCTYMLYSRIEKDNRFFDATVTFLPRSHASNDGSTTMRRPAPLSADGYEESDSYFTYEVTVKVYEYHYDPFTNAWVGRFAPDGSARFDGAPIAELHTGILNKSLNK
jgi:type II secretory pathway pseudopilin PulG